MPRPLRRPARTTTSRRKAGWGTVAGMTAAGVAAAVTVGMWAPANAAVVPEPIVHSAPDAALELAPLGSHETGVFDEAAAEIVTYHAATQQAFVINAQAATVDVLDLADPAAPSLVDTIEVAGIVDTENEPIPDGATANSVVVREDGLVVVAVESAVKTDPGWLAFLTADTLLPVGAVRVGAQPDMVTLTPDGSRAVVANEGEPADDFSVDPEGSITVADLPMAIAAPVPADLRVADFHQFEEGGSGTLPEDVRVFGPVVDSEFPISTNLEPEYVAVDPDGETAYVALQEANAVAVVDLETATVTDILPLGTKDHSIEGNGFDASNDDDAIAIQTWPVLGLFMPDGINAYAADGETYLVTANEGDAREWGDYVEPVRVADLAEDGPAPVCEDSPAAGLLGDTDLGRLNVTIADGLSADESCYEQLYAFGTRSFSIWNADGELVFDSGDEFERITAEAAPDFFNSNHSESGFDGRSDDKGPEPENLAIGTVGDRTYAFIGFERVGGIAVYDITTPAEAAFVTYVNNRDFSQSVEDGGDLSAAGDLGPEGIAFVPAAESPTSAPLLLVGNEVSGTTTVYAVTDLAAEPTPTPDPEPSPEPDPDPDPTDAPTQEPSAAPTTDPSTPGGPDAGDDSGTGDDTSGGGDGDPLPDTGSAATTTLGLGLALLGLGAVMLVRRRAEGFVVRSRS